VDHRRRSAWQWLFPAATLATLAAGVWWSRRDRGPLAVILLFGGTLIRCSGSVNVYPFVFSYVADHFQYLASLALIAFVAAAATRPFALLSWPRWSGPSQRPQCSRFSVDSRGARAECIATYSCCMRHACTQSSSWVAHLNLGTALAEAGQTEAALPHLQRALELKPGFPETLNSLGDGLNRLGRSREALPLLEQAVQIQPRFATAHNTLGVALMNLGRPPRESRNLSGLWNSTPRWRSRE